MSKPRRRAHLSPLPAPLALSAALMAIALSGCLEATEVAPGADAGCGESGSCEDGAQCVDGQCVGDEADMDTPDAEMDEPDAEEGQPDADPGGPDADPGGPDADPGGPDAGGCEPMEELCNGEDDDCDGTPDEDFTLGTPCDPGPGYCGQGETICGRDGAVECDTRGLERPGQEFCDGRDNDCDGATDEGTDRACYNGRPGTEGVGACQAGAQQCVDGDLTFECIGEIQPVAERCGDGVDDDCDTRVDQGCDCEGDEVRVCGSDVGACRPGMQRCMNGLWGACVDEIAPQQEDCNNIDDDCDGATDERVGPRLCYSGPEGTAGQGICRQGTQDCVNGAYEVVCNGEVLPEVADNANQDICDNRDVDCDGQTDEDHPRTPTACGVGFCAAAGVIACQNGLERDTCAPGQPQAQDLCNGIDDDCDGNTDEGHVRTPVECGVGFCAAQGAVECEAGRAVEQCTPGQPRPAEVCGANGIEDEVDDDCDGTVDEGCPFQTPTVEALMAQECGGCHNNARRSGGYTIADGFVAASANQLALGAFLDYIEPGDRNLSYVWHKVNGTQRQPPANGGGGRMPLGRVWNAYRLERFGAWIDQVLRP